MKPIFGYQSLLARLVHTQSRVILVRHFRDCTIVRDNSPHSNLRSISILLASIYKDVNFVDNSYGYSTVFGSTVLTFHYLSIYRRIAIYQRLVDVIVSCNVSTDCFEQCFGLYCALPLFHYCTPHLILSVLEPLDTIFRSFDHFLMLLLFLENVAFSSKPASHPFSFCLL